MRKEHMKRNFGGSFSVNGSNYGIWAGGGGGLNDCVDIAVFVQLLSLKLDIFKKWAWLLKNYIVQDLF